MDYEIKMLCGVLFHMDKNIEPGGICHGTFKGVGGG
jgi:hypothetical protein